MNMEHRSFLYFFTWRGFSVFIKRDLSPLSHKL